MEVRHILSRPSARDERNALATLLQSGPSSLEKVSEDLGLNYTIGQRTLSVFEHIGILERRTHSKYTISKSYISLTVFCLRETMGLDPLGAIKQDMERW